LYRTGQGPKINPTERGALSVMSKAGVRSLCRRSFSRSDRPSLSRALYSRSDACPRPARRPQCRNLRQGRTKCRPVRHCQRNTLSVACSTHSLLPDSRLRSQKWPPLGGLPTTLEAASKFRERIQNRAGGLVNQVESLAPSKFETSTTPFAHARCATPCREGALLINGTTGCTNYTSLVSNRFLIGWLWNSMGYAGFGSGRGSQIWAEKRSCSIS
jgi:hypothetical protein